MDGRCVPLLDEDLAVGVIGVPLDERAGFIDEADDAAQHVVQVMIGLLEVRRGREGRLAGRGRVKLLRVGQHRHGFGISFRVPVHELPHQGRAGFAGDVL
ncbi:MAG: hypothetical protein DCC65_17470, partial [Planctomycetota bacterium]